jgi:ComF family protein
MLHYFVNFLYPPRCAGCGVRMPIEVTRRVCPNCIARIERLSEPLCVVCGIPVKTANPEWCEKCTTPRPHFGIARAVARYRPGGDEESQTVPSLIRRHKYGRDQSLAHALAECLSEPLPVDDSYDVVVPIPLHRARLRWRGFNQAALLGTAVARRLGRPLDAVALSRIRAPSPQTYQVPGERRRNVRRAFAVTRRNRVTSRRVLLVDDVMTTGATADECARTLLAAGARRVDVLTLARAV